MLRRARPEDADELAVILRTAMRGAMPSLPELHTPDEDQRNDGARRFYEKHGLHVVELTEGSGNEEREPDALYEWVPQELVSKR